MSIILYIVAAFRPLSKTLRGSTFLICDTKLCEKKTDLFNFPMLPPTLALPGQLLGPSSKYSPGPGTHLHESLIYASLAGATQVIRTRTPTSTLPILSIPRLLPSPTTGLIPSSTISNTNTLPEVGSVVLCRVTRLTTKQANVAILVVEDEEEGRVCADEWAGVVRREDVRATEKEKVVVAESFRVGDVVRGVVVCRSVLGVFWVH